MTNKRAGPDRGPGFALDPQVEGPGIVHQLRPGVRSTDV